MPFVDTNGLKVIERLPGWKGRYVHSPSMTFAHYEFAAGSKIHEHFHPEEEVYEVIEGELELIIDGKTEIAKPGIVAIVPANIRHSVRALTDGRLIVVDHPARTEFSTAGPIPYSRPALAAGQQFAQSRITVFTLPGVRKFYDWAHASLTLLLNHLSTMAATEYAREVPGFGFPTVRAQVIHILNCEGFWIHTLQAIPFYDQDPANWPTVSDARLLQSEVSMRTLNYLSRLSEQNLIVPTELHFSDGEVAVRTPALILHHILTHAFHHKGQIVSMCRILGYPAPDTDLDRFE